MTGVQTCALPISTLEREVQAIKMRKSSKNSKGRNGLRRKSPQGGANLSGRRVPTLLTGHAMTIAIGQLPVQQIFRCKKWASTFTNISQAQVDTFGTFQFQLADIEKDPSFALLFQQYRIPEIEIFFRPMFRANPTTSTILIPQILLAVDPNDISSWGTVGEASSNDGLVVIDDQESFGIRFAPRVAVAAYNGAFSGFSTTDAPIWIDTSYNSVRHYGLKYAITGSGSAAGNDQAWNVSIRYTLEFRIGK